MTHEIKQAVARFRERHGYDDTTPRAALIDMDGTLYDSMPRHTVAWETMAREAGLSTIPGEFFLHEGRTGAATIDILMMRNRHRHATEEEKQYLYKRKTEIFVELPPVEPMKGADVMTDIMRNAGLTRVLVTGSGQNSLIGRLDTDYPGIFAADKRITSRDVTNGKPHPEPFLKAMARAGVTPAHAIVIENAPLGVEAGAASGAFTVAVTTGPIPRHELEKAGADIIFSSMPEFAASLPSLLQALAE